MRHLLLLSLFLLNYLYGCQDIQSPPEPDRKLSEDEMVAVMIDIALAHAAKSYDKSLMEKNGMLPSAYVYDKNGIDSITFAQNNIWYSGNVRLYKRIFAQVKDSVTALRTQLERKQEVLDSTERAEKQAKDSLATPASAQDSIAENT